MLRRDDLVYPEFITGKRIFDFLVDEKVIVELKKENRYAKQHVDQVKEYLATSHLKLALLISFSKTKVDSMRVVNLQHVAQGRDS